MTCHKHKPDPSPFNHQLSNQSSAAVWLVSVRQREGERRGSWGGKVAFNLVYNMNFYLEWQKINVEVQPLVLQPWMQLKYNHLCADIQGSKEHTHTHLYTNQLVHLLHRHTQVYSQNTHIVTEYWNLSCCLSCADTHIVGLKLLWGIVLTYEFISWRPDQRMRAQWQRRRNGIKKDHYLLS